MFLLNLKLKTVFGDFFQILYSLFVPWSYLLLQVVQPIKNRNLHNPDIAYTYTPKINQSKIQFTLLPGSLQ